MNPFAQVFHYIENDLRRNWIPFVAYIAGWGLLMTRPLSEIGKWGIASDFAQFTLVALAPALIAAVLVQEDSPLGPGSYWRSKPINPHALIVAKIIAIAALLIGAPYVSIALVHRASSIRVVIDYHDLRFVPLSALVGLVIGSVTKEIKTFILVSTMLSVLSVFVGDFLFMYRPYETAFFPPSKWRVVTIVLLHVLALIEVHVFYDRRDLKQKLALPLALLTLLPILGYFYATANYCGAEVCLD